jgi:selenocysteine-specific elongation factor
MIGQGVAQGELVVTSKGVALATHRVALPAAEIGVLDRLAEAMRAAGLDPPDPWRLLAAEGIGAPRVEALVRLLRERGDLVRVAERILVHREAIAALKRSLYERRAGEPWLDVAAFKALTGTSRRMAIPLLEFLDAERVTARRGDRRLILEPPRGVA